MQRTAHNNETVSPSAWPLNPFPGHFVPQVSPTLQNNVEQLPPSSHDRPVRRAVTSNVPVATNKLTDIQNYYFRCDRQQLVQALLRIDDVGSPSPPPAATVAAFMKDVEFALRNGNDGKRRLELPALLRALQAASNFNSRMRNTQTRAIHWATETDPRLVPYVRSAVLACRRSVLKELYLGQPIRGDLINVGTVIKKVTKSGEAAGILQTRASTSSPLNLHAPINEYFAQYEAAEAFPFLGWARGEFPFRNLDQLLQVALRGKKVDGGRWTHYVRNTPLASPNLFIKPSSVNYGQNLAGLPSRVTKYEYGSFYPTTVLVASEHYSFDGHEWLPIKYPTNPALEELKHKNFEALIDRGKTLVSYMQPRMPTPPPS
jgi:hypothetical protein